MQLGRWEMLGNQTSAGTPPPHKEAQGKHPGVQPAHTMCTALQPHYAKHCVNYQLPILALAVARL